VKLLHVCADPECPELCEPGEPYCAEHALDAADVRQASDRKIKARSTWRWVYKDPRWQGLRRQVRLEQPFCIVAGCQELTHDIDHVVALQDGGAPFDRDNVQGMCAKDHARKTREEVRARYG